MSRNQKPFRILVIDDDADDQFFFQRALGRVEPIPEVSLVDSAGRAIEFLSALEPDSALSPDVILCDVKMPVMTGFEFVRWLRSSPHKKLPVVLCSTSTLPQDVDQAYGAGANSFVSKPHGHDTIQKLLQDLVYYWRDVAVLPEAR
jgi:chemotaxis family two-component system response regulator Rcp1